MSASDFHVVFTGSLCEGVSRREGIARLSKRFGLEFQQIKRLLSGEPRVVKRFEHRSEAQRLVSAFRAAGWNTEIRAAELPSSGRGTSAAVSAETSQVNPVEGIQTMPARDNSCVLNVPASWQTLQGLNKNAVVQVGNLDDNEFCVVLWQSVQQVGSAAAMKDYCSAQLSQCAGQINDGGVASTAAPLKRGNFDGFVGEITAKIDEIPVRYLVACMHCNGRVFTQFLWCESQEFEQKRVQLLDVIASFQVETARSPVAAPMGRMSRRKRRMRA